MFDVDIGDGEPIRKLPYNRSGIFVSCKELIIFNVWLRVDIFFKSICCPYLCHISSQSLIHSDNIYILLTCVDFVPDNPYDTADKWLLKENLPLSYRQQIVDFILENTGQKAFSFDSSFRDPFTGCKLKCFCLTWIWITFISLIMSFGLSSQPMLMYLGKLLPTMVCTSVKMVVYIYYEFLCP